MENTTMSASERLRREYAAVSNNYDKTINDLNKGLKDCQKTIAEIERMKGK